MVHVEDADIKTLNNNLLKSMPEVSKTIGRMISRHKSIRSIQEPIQTEQIDNLCMVASPPFFLMKKKTANADDIKGTM